MPKKKTVKVKAGYRNDLESGAAEQLEAGGVEFTYESLKLPVHYEYVSNYTPDFISKHTPIILETKGFFHDSVEDRKKLVMVKKQHPEWDIRLVFERASTPIRKGSKTTYGDWATKEGFQWSDKGKVPQEWIKDMQLQNSASGIKSRSALVAGSGKATKQRKVTVNFGSKGSWFSPTERHLNSPTVRYPRAASCATHVTTRRALMLSTCS